MARQRSAKPCTAVRIRSRPQKIKIEQKIIKKMGVTRLKRKDRKNKTVSRLKKQRLKMATDKSIKKPVARPEVAATEATSAE